MTQDQDLRADRITRAIQEAAELAILEVTLANLEDRIMRHSHGAPSIPELRDAVGRLHNATVTIPPAPETTKETPSS